MHYKSFSRSFGFRSPRISPLAKTKFWISSTASDRRLYLEWSGITRHGHIAYIIGYMILGDHLSRHWRIDRKSLKGYEPFYVGRTCSQLKEGRTLRPGRWMNFDNEYKNNETQLPGKIHLSHNCLYVGFEGKEYAFKEWVFSGWLLK